MSLPVKSLQDEAVAMNGKLRFTSVLQSASSRLYNAVFSKDYRVLK
jgi:hypothetical protein